MAVISAAQYIALSDYLASAKSTLLSAKLDAYSAVYEIALYDEITSSIDLLAPFFSSYESITTATQFNTSLNAAVRALNNHVIRRTRASLDTFLSGAAVQVDPVFAAMSAELGFDIDPANIA